MCVHTRACSYVHTNLSFPSLSAVLLPSVMYFDGSTILRRQRTYFNTLIRACLLTLKGGMGMTQQILLCFQSYSRRVLRDQGAREDSQRLELHRSIVRRHVFVLPRSPCSHHFSMQQSFQLRSDIELCLRFERVTFGWRSFFPSDTLLELPPFGLGVWWCLERVGVAGGGSGTTSYIFRSKDANTLAGKISSSLRFTKLPRFQNAILYCT